MYPTYYPLIIWQKVRVRMFSDENRSAITVLEMFLVSEINYITELQITVLCAQ